MIKIDKALVNYIILRLDTAEVVCHPMEIDTSMVSDHRRYIKYQKLVAIIQPVLKQKQTVKNTTAIFIIIIIQKMDTINK